MIFTVISVVLILAGMTFFLGGAVGIVRFPDFYARMHAAGKGDTLSSFLVILGFAVYQLNDFHGFSHDWPVLLVILKLIGVSIFILLTSPTSTNALIDAGYEDEVKPVLEKGRPNHLAEDCKRTK